MHSYKKCVSIYESKLSGDLLFENSITPMMIVDGNRTITKANKRFYDLFGYSPEEILGLQTYVLTPTVEHFEAYKKYFEQTRDGSYESSELQYKKKDGTLFWVKLRGIPIEIDKSKFIIWSFDDITREVEAKELIKTKNRELEIIFDKVQTGLVYILNGIIERANSSFVEMLNEDSSNVIGRNITLFFECFDKCSCKGGKKTISLHKGDGASIMVEREIIPVNENSFVIVMTDVTEHITEKENLTVMAQTDGLTRIYNRNTFVSMAQEAMVDASHEAVTFVMFDIDHFKMVNDTFGHDVGDDVLCELTSLIKEHLRKGEVFGRLGGEEFGLIFYMPKERAVNVCERLMDAVREAVFTRKCLQITVSMGVVDNRISNVFDTLYKEADKRLYKAKQSGRDRIEI